MPSALAIPLPMPTRHEAYLRHARCYVALAEEANAQLSGPDQSIWLQELDADYACLLAALRWLRSQNDGVLGSRLALALSTFWEVRGYWAEGRQWLEAMAAVKGPLDEALLARVLNEAGVFCRMLCDWEGASELFLRALEIHEKHGDLKGRSITLNGLGVAALMQGQQAAAKKFFEEALAVSYQRGDPANIARGLGNLALVYSNDRDYAAAKKLQEESLSIQRIQGGKREIADGLTNLGNSYFFQGDYEEAKRCYQESLELKEKLNYQPGLGNSYINLATLSKKLGEYSEAYDYVRESLIINKNVGDMEGFACVFEIRAEVAAVRGLSEWVILWYAAAAALRRKHHVPLRAADAKEIKNDIAGIRASLGEQAFQRAWRRGRAMSLPCAIALALKGDDETASL